MRNQSLLWIVGIMASKFFIDWTSRHILKINFSNGLSFTEYSYNEQRNPLVQFHFKLPKNFLSSVKNFFETSQTVSPNSIYTENGNLYCFKNGDLQYGSRGQYIDMAEGKPKDNFLCYGDKFVQLGEKTLYLITISREKEFYENVNKYYPMSELVYLHAKELLKLEKWDKQFSRTLFLKVSRDLATAECWIDMNTLSVLLENTLKVDCISFFKNIIDSLTSCY